MGHRCIICLSELQDLCCVPEEEITVWICHLFCMSVCLPLFTWSTYYAFSACAEKKVTFWFALCVICQSVKTLTNMPDNTSRMSRHVSTLYHSVVRHVLAVNLILDIIDCVGRRVKCWLQNASVTRLWKRWGPGLSWRKALLLSGSHWVVSEPLL